MSRYFGLLDMVRLKFSGLRSAACILTVCLCIGCSTLFAPQQLSENYARASGVICNAPMAVDGDLETVSNRTRILITLPEAKSIRKIIIYSPNISNFIVYESIGQEGEWRPMASVKGNKSTKIVVNTQATTDKIRIFITDTTGTRFAKPGVVKNLRGRDVQVFSRQVDARPIIQEIELYGLVDVPQEIEPEEIEPEAPLF